MCHDVVHHIEEGMTTGERLWRIDQLLCLLFEGFMNHPLATSMIPPAELEQIKELVKVK